MLKNVDKVMNTIHYKHGYLKKDQKRRINIWKVTKKRIEASGGEVEARRTTYLKNLNHGVRKR